MSEIKLYQKRLGRPGTMILKETEQAIIQEYNTCLSLKKISERFKIGKRRLTNILRENGIEVSYHRLHITYPLVDDNFLDKIDTE